MQLHWDPDHAYDPRQLEKSKALDVPPIYGVLPYTGARNPLTRSNTAHRICTTFSTPATRGQRKVYLFDGEAEYAVGLEIMLDPDVHALDVQLPFFRYRAVRGSKGLFPKHYFDLRITFSDGFRRAIYVKNGSSLGRRETKDEIDAIQSALPDWLADDMIVVDGDDYVRPLRGNLFRFWSARQEIDEAADAHLEEKARTCSYWYLKDLTAKCDMPPDRLFQAALRLVSRNILGADWYSVFNKNSRVWLK